jgi:hypothetical protein
MNIRSVHRVGAVIAVFTLISCFWLIPTLSIRKYSPQTKFSPSLWQAATVANKALSVRQKMIRDLILNVLPGRSRTEVEELLGKSPTHEDMRRHSQADMLVRERNDDGTWKPSPRTGIGYYFEERDWDSIYFIGYEQQSFIRKHSELLPNIREEMLIVRYDTNDVFSSWYVDGSKLWPQVVGGQGKRSFKRQRE